MSAEGPVKKKNWKQPILEHGCEHLNICQGYCIRDQLVGHLTLNQDSKFSVPLP